MQQIVPLLNVWRFPIISHETPRSQTRAAKHLPLPAPHTTMIQHQRSYNVTVKRCKTSIMTYPQPPTTIKKFTDSISQSVNEGGQQPMIHQHPSAAVLSQFRTQLRRLEDLERRVEQRVRAARRRAMALMEHSRTTRQSHLRLYLSHSYAPEVTPAGAMAALMKQQSPLERTTPPSQAVSSLLDAACGLSTFGGSFGSRSSCRI